MPRAEKISSRASLGNNVGSLKGTHPASMYEYKQTQRGNFLSHEKQANRKNKVHMADILKKSEWDISQS